MPHHVAGAHRAAVGVDGDCDASIGRGKCTRHRVELSWPVILSTGRMRHCMGEGEVVQSMRDGHGPHHTESRVHNAIRVNHVMLSTWHIRCIVSSHDRVRSVNKGTVSLSALMSNRIFPTT